MIHLGLIGYPLGHSLSPWLHTAALRECNLRGDYSLFPIQRDDLQGLKSILGRVRTREVTGLNVTIPHKQTVVSFLDELTPPAQAIGAVNTIYLRQDKLIGDNTDAPGFLADVKRLLTTESCFDGAPPVGTSQPRLRHGASRALVLGAGGSARAVVYALVNHGWNVSIAARRLQPAHQLASSFSNQQLCVSDSTLSNIELSNITLIVNTTPVGMHPNTNESPWPAHLLFPRNAAIYDLVYNPRVTKLVKDARSQGLSAMTGIGMLVEQAALAFELWAGQKPPRDVMFDAVNQTAH